MHLTGHSERTPFNFKNYNMTLCGLLKNNEPIPNRPYQTNFPTEGGGEYITAFQSLSTDIAGGCYDHGKAISREDFPNGYGYTLISFDTSADLYMCPKAYFDIIDKGGLKLELQFGSALTQDVNIIVYAEFNNLREINGNRDVIHNFAELEMNASELEEILKKIVCINSTFGDVYPSDLLPLEVKQYPQFFVANVHTSEKPGTHWVAFYIIDYQHGEFIDTQNIVKIP